jgi:hypothetical protein
MRQEKFQNCIRICLECATQCYRTANESLKEEEIGDLIKCVQLTRECAEMCLSTARILTLGSSHAKDVCVVCADYCIRSAEECDKHPQLDHCRMTSLACRRCVEECEKMIQQYQTRY